MKRHVFASVGAVIAMTVGLTLIPGQATAQVAGGATGSSSIFSDPFAFYYAVYLPNQMLQASRPSPLDAINNAMPVRQYYAQTNRGGLYDPVSPYADTYDPLRPFSNQQRERRAAVRPFATSTSNAAGRGPALYFHRVAQYYPGLANRPTQQRNANVSARRGGNRFGGGAGGGAMGGMGMGGMGMGGMGMF